MVVLFFGLDMIAAYKRNGQVWKLLKGKVHEEVTYKNNMKPTAQKRKN